MKSVEDNATSAISDSPSDSAVYSPVKRRMSMSARSLSPRAESFASFGEEGEKRSGCGIRENSKLGNELKELSERVSVLPFEMTFSKRVQGFW